MDFGLDGRMLPRHRRQTGRLRPPPAVGERQDVKRHRLARKLPRILLPKRVRATSGKENGNLRSQVPVFALSGPILDQFFWGSDPCKVDVTRCTSIVVELGAEKQLSGETRETRQRLQD